ncbi:MAG TPA: hypothetical protein VF786_11835 [Terriglobales bacterium]
MARDLVEQSANLLTARFSCPGTILWTDFHLDLRWTLPHYFSKVAGRFFDILQEFAAAGGSIELKSC